MEVKRRFLMMLISLLTVILSTNLCFAAPTITSITPTSGPVGGGTEVTVYGTGFVDGTNVYIGWCQATVTYVAPDGTSLKCTTSSCSAGVGDVVVSNPDNQSATLKDAFTYFANIIYVNKNDSTCDGKKPCYTSIQDAINRPGSGYNILKSGGTYTEPISLNESKTVTLKGGWDSSFKNQSETTILRNAPKAPQGSITLQMLRIIP